MMSLEIILITIVILIVSATAITMVYKFWSWHKSTRGYQKMDLLNKIILFFHSKERKPIYQTNAKWCKYLRDNWKIILTELNNYRKTHNLPTFGQVSFQHRVMARVFIRNRSHPHCSF